MTNGVFSEYEVTEQGIKFDDSESYESANCVGSSEEEMETRIVTKKCRGVVVKETVTGTGKGKLKLSLHMPWAIYTEIYGMTLDTLIDGVKAYGRNSRHKKFSLTQHVFDEDGEEKFKAYPYCIVETGLASKIENGAEEVAEIEMELAIMPDEFGNGVYQTLASELKDESVKNTWMTAFTPALVQAPTV